MRRPKGIKTKKSVAKRFKITATGKVLRSAPAAAIWPKPKTPSAAPPRQSRGHWIQPTLTASPRACRSAIAADWALNPNFELYN